MSTTSFLTSWIQGQKLKGPQMKGVPTFYRNLEDALDARRADHAMFTRTKSAWKTGAAVNFCSNDLLSLGATGELRTAFLEELAQHPGFALHAGGSRMMEVTMTTLRRPSKRLPTFTALRLLLSLTRAGREI